MKNKSAGKTKRLLGYALAIILVAAAFVSANVGGFTPKKAEAAYTPPLPFGGTAYTTSTAANQTGMVYLTDYTSYSGLQGGAIRVFNQNDGQSANHWHLEGGRKNNGYWMITARLDDHLYSALVSNRAEISVSTYAYLKNANVVENAGRKFQSFLVFGNISGSGLGINDFTAVSGTYTGNKCERNDKSDGGHTSTVTYSGSGNFGRYVRFGVAARLESNGGCFIGICNHSKAQMNDVAISITINKKSADSSAPSVSGTSGAWTTSPTITITDNESGIWKYTINGSATVVRTDGGRTTSINVDLDQGENKIVAYNNHSVASAEKTIRYYNPTVSAQANTNGSPSTVGGTITLDSSSTTLTKNGKTVGGSYSFTAAENAGYYFHSWYKQGGASQGHSYAKNFSYTIAEGDAYTTPLTFNANFLSISVENTTHVYNGSPQGVNFNPDTGFNAEYFYTNRAGTPAWSSATAPTAVGQYDAQIIVKRGSTQMGTKTVLLTITKANPTFDLSDVNLNPLYTGQSQGISGAKVNSGGAITYVNNSFTNVGEYQVTINAAATANYNAGSTTVTVKVQKATYDLSGISFNNATYTYDGTPKYISITGTLPAGLSVEYYPYNNMVNAGSVQIQARFIVADTDNYNDIRDPLIAILTINKATYNMSGVTFPSGTFVYDGSPKQIQVSGTLPAGVSINYVNNTRTIVGSQTAQANFVVSDPNYNNIPLMSATITITKGTYNMSGVSFTNQQYVYDGTEKALTITGSLPGGVRVEYTANKLTNVGSTQATAKFFGDEVNYFAIPDRTATLTITKATNNLVISVPDTPYASPVTVNVVNNSGGSISYQYKVFGAPDNMYSAQVPTALGDYTVKAYSEATQNYFAAETTANFSIVKAYYDLSGIAFNNASYVYDKTEKEITITGTLPGGVSVQYTDNKLTNVGSTLATATFSGDTVNYYPIELVLNATLTITKAVYDMSGVSFTDKYFSFEDGVVREITINGELPEGVTVWYENNTLDIMGFIDATAHFEGDYANYEVIPPMYARLNVTDRGTFDLSGLSWNYSEPFTFDGNTKTITVNGLTYNSAFGYYTIDGISPDHLKVTQILGASARDAGNYTASLVFNYNASNYNPPNFPPINWSILKATHDMSGVIFEDRTFTYDGHAKTLEISGNLPLGIIPMYSANTLTDAGSIEVTVTFDLVEPGNYYPISPMSATLTVEKAQNPLSFKVDSFNYGAQVYIYDIVNPSGGGLSFRYKPKGADDSVYSPVEPTQAGEYVVRAQSLETINYYAATVTREFTINKADYNMSGVTFEDATYTYDGEEKTLTISGTLPAGVSVSYSQNALTDAGFIEVVASFEGDYLNYNHISAKIAILTINKAENPVIISVSDSVIGNDLNITIENNLGEEAVVYFKAQGASDETYTLAVPTELGSYTVKVICAESMNYLEKIVVANFRITKPNYDMSGVSFNNKTVTYNGEEHTITITGELPEGVSVSYSANAVQINAGVYVITAYFTGDTENYNTIPEKTAILTVERAENELEIEAHDIVYNQAIDISVITNTANATIRYFYKKQGEDDIYFSDIAPRALGNYVVKAESLQTLNYNSRVAYSEFSISKATYDMSGISFSDANYIYDGSEKVLVISGELPQGVIVNYLPTNRMTNVGSIHVTASFEGDPINYFSIPSVQAWLVIEKAVNNLSASIDDIVYGQNLDIRVTNPNGGSLLFNFKPQDADDEAYTDAKPVNAGLYTAKIYSAATENYTEAYYLVDFEIRKAVLNIGNVTFEDAEFEYDGTEKFISVSGVLPAGVNAYYENRSRTEVGSQTATVELRPLSGADNYIPLEPLTATLTIRKAANNLIVRVSDVFINDELDIEVINPTGGTLTYLYKAQGAGDFTSVAPTAPGAYILKVISAETDNYVEAEREVSFNINKFNYDMTGVQFTNATYVYDGTEKTLTISGDLPEGVSVSYSANTLVNAGSLEVVATFTGDNSLYNPITPKVATLAIHKAVIDMTGVTFADKRVPYDGYRKSLVITGTLPEGVTVTYLNNTLTKVGTVVATAQFNHNSPNHEPIPSLTASLSVQRGTYNMSGVTFEDATYIYDGQVKIITVKGKLPEGVSVSYSSNALMHPGRVVATARFVGDSENYEPIPHMTATLTVEEYVPLVSMVKSAEIQKITSKDNTITAILANDAQSFTLGLQVKDNAEYKLYTDEACTQELENGALTLQEGSQIVYVKVTMADGSEQVVKINLTRAEAPLLSPQLTLVLLGASAITIMTLLVLVLKGKKLKPKKAR